MPVPARLLAAFCFLTMLQLTATRAPADQKFTTNTTIDNQVLTVDPAGALIVNHASNNPLLTLTNGTTTEGVEAVILGDWFFETGQLLIDNGSVLNNLYPESYSWLGKYALEDAFRGNAYIGMNVTSSGVVTVRGQGTEWNNSNTIYVGYRGDGTLNIENGATVTSDTGLLGLRSESNSLVNVDGSGSHWVTNRLYVGTAMFHLPLDQHAGAATLRVTNGGQVTSNFAEIGSGGQGLALVSGKDSRWDVADLMVGLDRHGILHITEGGTVTTEKLVFIGRLAEEPSTVLVRDSNSSWDVANTVYVGYNGSPGEISVENGGTIMAKAVSIQGDSASLAKVSGSDSQLAIEWDLEVNGKLVVENGGTATAYSLFAGAFAGESAQILVTGEGSLLSIGSSNSRIGASIPSTLTISQGGRVEATELMIFYENSVLTGDGGTLQVDHAISRYAIINDGVIAPGDSTGTLTVDGSLESSGSIELEIAGAADFDHLIITKDLYIDGIVKIILTDDFQPLSGDSFKLLTFGNFESRNMLFDFSEAQFLNPALSWDTSDFASNGTIRVVPEPGSLVLGVVGIAFTAAYVWRRKRSRLAC